MLSSARRGILYPNPDRSDRPDVPAHILNVVNALEQDVLFDQGLDSDRQSAAHQLGGGRFWWCTDTLFLWYDDGTNWNQLAAGVALIPPGALTPFAGSVAPAGYLLCDGSAVSRTTYANLFAAIGTVFGGGNGTSTFNIPNMGGRVPMGVGTATGAVGATAHALGAIGGEETHVLTVTELASHGHPITSDSAGTPAGTISSVSAGTPAGSITGSGTHAHNIHVLEPQSGGVVSDNGMPVVSNATSVIGATTDTDGTHTHAFSGTLMGTHVHTFAGTALAGHTHTISSTGGGTAHNNLQPYIVMNYIIKT